VGVRTGLVANETRLTGCRNGMEHVRSEGVSAHKTSPPFERVVECLTLFFMLLPHFRKS